MRVSRFLLPSAFMALGCADGRLATGPAQTAVTASESVVQQNAAVHWNGIARGLVAKYSSNALVAIRGHALVAVAQHNAAASVLDPGVHAAISAASAVTLSYLYPNEQNDLELQLQQYLAAAGTQHDVVDGETAGRAAGNRVVAYAQTDRFFAPWTGTVPVGPGLWFSATPPVGATVGQAKTYFLLTNNQFRPAPHPVFGSPEFLAAVAEVRQISDNRTPEQDSIAKFWNFPAGTYQPPGYWNAEGGRLATKYGLSERRAAHMFAQIQMVAYDALVASHEAKFTYWLLRPTMADPGIQLAIGLPNFPSYPSNHAAISAGMAAVLGSEFPAERLRLKGLADEAALSRVYGGIHYRFDGVAGLTLGRRVADWALGRDFGLRQPFA